MDNFTFWSPTKFIFGRDTELQAGHLVSQFGGKNLLLVYGTGSAVRSGLLDRVRGSLRDNAIRWTELGGIRPNPTDDRVREGIAVAREQAVDMILAVGGGSVIDTAKAIACGVPYEGDFWDFYCGRRPVEKALPVGVVLTIPAAGSEGSGNSVITLRDGLIKLSLRTESALRPKFAIMNPALTLTLPPYQTACGIVDMMAHIFERYFTPTPDCEVTDRVAEGLLSAIIDQGRRVITYPDDYQARANIMWSATLAHNGLCGCGRREDWSSHFIEHELSAVYDVPHGAGLAVIMPAWMEYVARRKPDKVAQFATRVMGVETHIPDNDSDDLPGTFITRSRLDIALEGISRLRGFFSSIGMPSTMRQLGIADPDIPALVKALHLHKGDTFGAYIPLSATDTAAIYTAAI